MSTRASAAAVGDASGELSGELSDRVSDGAVLRPQSVLFTFFGDFVPGADVLVASSTVVDLLGRVGVAEAAARATLSRMTRRGLLRREVRGRNAYFGLTDVGRRTVLDGRTRVREVGVATSAPWDGAWTVVAFSMPETWQRERHGLRARLAWAGFGMVQAGLWVAPRRVDVVEALDGLGIDDHVRVFTGAPAAPTDATRLVAEAYDLPALAARYEEFLARWQDVEAADPARTDAAQARDDPAGGDDPLARLVVLSTDWLQTVRDDPRLPLDFLPPDWPAVRAEALYRRLLASLVGPAEARFRAEADLLPAS